MMLHRLPILLLLVLAGGGCTSHKMFVGERNFDIGRVITDVPVPDPIEIEPIDDQTSRYIIEFKDTGCRWSYTVENSTKKILSWQYISNPDLCYMTMSLVP